MSTGNMFENIYRRKSDEELMAIVADNDASEDSILCALAILKERGIRLDYFDEIEQQIIAKRNNRVVSQIAYDRYSTGFNRFIALIIDGLFLSAAGFFTKFYSMADSMIFAGILSWIQLTLPYLYNIVMHSHYGQTLGKMAMGIKIFDQSERKLISYRQALIRDIVPLTLVVITQLLTLLVVPTSLGILTYISIFMGFLIGAWSILEIITMLFNDKRRALHDLIAGTVVLKVNT